MFDSRCLENLGFSQKSSNIKSTIITLPKAMSLMVCDWDKLLLIDTEEVDSILRRVIEEKDGNKIFFYYFKKQLLELWKYCWA